MPDFAVRIELNGPPDSETYDAVHEAMSNFGYARSIMSNDGRHWKLPKGMYDGTSSRDYKSERDALYALISPIWPDCEIIAFEYGPAAWVGLKQLPHKLK